MVQVLIVDGDDAISETMRYVLEEAGHSVLELPNYTKALAFLRSSPSCCVVIFDRGVPGRYGSAFVAAITGDEMLSRQHAYICLSTSPSHLRSVENDIFDRLAIPIIAKPFDIEGLEEAVRQSAQLCKLIGPGQQVQEPTRTR